MRAKRLYLDQQQWIRLAKGKAGLDPKALELLRLIEDLVAKGNTVAPLSMAHWAETWHRGDWRSRWNLSRVMWDTSRLVSLAPFHGLISSEIDLELNRRLGRPTWPQRIQPLGIGVNHAWSTNLGRLRYVEWTDGTGREGRNVVPPRGITEAPRHLYEWFSLAGLPEDMRIDGLDLQESRRAGEHWAHWERSIGQFLRTIDKTERQSWIAWSLFEDIWNYVVDRCNNIGTIPEIAIGRGLEAIERFLHSIPITDCLLILRSLRHQNSSQKWLTNDRLDLLALAVAIPLCDVVVTERQWAHFARRAKLHERYGTLVTSSLEEGVDFLLQYFNKI